jgi:lysophospholipase L1-like esterase
MRNIKEFKLINTSMTRLIIMLSVVLLIVAILYFYGLQHKHSVSEKHATTILCAGDSITAGTDGSYPEFLQQMLDRSGKHVFVVNRGTPGNTSGEYIHYLKQTKLIDSLDIDIVLLQLGTNDVRIDTDHTTTDMFYKNMEYIIGMFRTHTNRDGSHPMVMLATIPPIVVTLPLHFTEESARRVVTEINPAIKKLASENQCPLVDQYALFVERPTLLPNIHPNQDGYIAMAEIWFNALQPYL